ncbi:helix-turn-helix domain-containing protein [Marinicrinis lubricantis]|uniref:Helix-turn-helix domain-containing protein n=1 Tax=Marinicrinis lubricantis TaxID=2086470 RepID=A0ABW1IS01_9BACL
MNHELQALCSHISESFHLPVFLLDTKGKPLLELTSSYTINPLYLHHKDRLFRSSSLHINTSLDFPIVATTPFYENFICIHIHEDGIYRGTLLLGPSTTYPLSDREIAGLLSDYPQHTDRTGFIRYYHSLPVIKKEQLIHMGILVHYMVNHTLWSYDQVLEKNKELKRSPIHIEPPEIEVSKRLQKVVFHHDPLVEKRLLNHIKEGRVDEVRKSFGAIPEEEFGVLSKSSFLRSRKNIAISAITIATRSAMEGGLHPEIAYTLSDVFIQQVEEVHQINDINHLVEEAMCAFAEKVLGAKEESSSRIVTVCKNYIFKHLYDSISLNDLADHTKLNPSYLSKLFKKETGITMTEYIQKVRIDEAKNLLSLTQTPISEISSWMHFTDQSYFTKIFKKHVGVTPKRFREKNHRTIGRLT